MSSAADRVTLGSSAPSGDHGVHTIQRTGTQAWGAAYYQTTLSATGHVLYIELSEWGGWYLSLDDGMYTTEGDYAGGTFTDYYGVDWLSDMTGATATESATLGQMVDGQEKRDITAPSGPSRCSAHVQ